MVISNGNGNGVFALLGKLAITGFCGLCFAGFFYLSSRVEANFNDHGELRYEAETRVESRNNLIREMIALNEKAHSDIVQRLSRIEALLK
jgi:hypothetical protein